MPRLRRLTPTICAFHLGFSLGSCFCEHRQGGLKELGALLGSLGGTAVHWGWLTGRITAFWSLPSSGSSRSIFWCPCLLVRTWYCSDRGCSSGCWLVLRFYLRASSALFAWSGVYDGFRGICEEIAPELHRFYAVLDVIIVEVCGDNFVVGMGHCCFCHILVMPGVRPAQLRKLDLIPCGTAGEPTLWSNSERSSARMYCAVLCGGKMRPWEEPVRSWT